MTTQQRQPKLPLNGWLNVDKPLGMSSAAVVNRLKWLIHPQKIGHAGTLDPLASGVLPIAFGEATKTIPYCMEALKTYQFTIKFGEATTTEDAEGEVIQQSNIRPTLEEVEAKLPQFIGEISQIPPAYSAIKINGERAYALARKGQQLVMQPRTIIIYQLKVIKTPSSEKLEEITLEAQCSKGTYIRSLARDFACALGTYGHVVMLRRVEVGNFTEKNTILLENIEKMVHSANASEIMSEVLLSVDAVLDDILVLHVDEATAQRLRYGQVVSFYHDKVGVVRVYVHNQLLGMVESDGKTLTPIRLFNL